MPKVNQVKAGALLSYVSMGLSVAISLVYTPVMINRLGTSEYGVYQMALPIISYLNILSFGLSSAYVRYYSRYKVAGNRRGMARLNGMFITTYCVLGAILLTIGFILSNHGEVIFGNKLSESEIELGCTLLRIMSVNAALTFPLSVFESHIVINEKYLFQKTVAMGKQVLNPLLMIPLLLLGFKSVTLTIVSLCFTIFSGILNISYCLVKLKMPISFACYDFSLMKEMFGFTFYVFLGILVDNFNWSIDRLLLGWIHGTTAVTIYVVASQLNIFYLDFSVAISNVLTPRVHRLVAKDRPMEELNDLFCKVGRLQYLLLSCILFGFVAVGRSFVVLWGGDSMFSVDYYVTLLLFFASIWTNIQTVGIEIQRAKNMHKFRSVVYLLVAISNAIVSIPLCMRWEGLGAAIGTTISTFVGNVLIMNWYYEKKIGLDIKRFWGQILRMSKGLLIPGACAVLLSNYTHPTTYLGLVLPGCAYVMVFAASMWYLGINKYERDLICGPYRHAKRSWRNKMGGKHLA